MGWLDKYQDGGDVNPAMTGMMKSKIGMGNAFNHPSIKRMSQALPKTGMTPEGEGTHFMTSQDNYAVPLLQDLGGETLEYISNPKPSREDIRFNTPEEAEYFARHYKEVAPMSTIFKDVPRAQAGKNVPATRQDSLDVYNSSIKALNSYNSAKYKGKKAYKVEPSIVNYDVHKENDDMIKIRKRSNRISDYDPFLDKEIKHNYRTTIDKNRYTQKESADQIINTGIPAQLFDRRIEPRGAYYFSPSNTNNAGEIINKDPSHGDWAIIYSYANIANKPFDLLTEKEKAQRVKLYGTDGVPKSYLNKTGVLPLSTSSKKSTPTTVEPIPREKQTPIASTPLNIAPVNSDVELKTSELTPLARIPKKYKIETEGGGKFGGWTRYETVDNLEQATANKGNKQTITPIYQSGGSISKNKPVIIKDERLQGRVVRDNIPNNKIVVQTPTTNTYAKSVAKKVQPQLSQARALTPEEVEAQRQMVEQAHSTNLPLLRMPLHYMANPNHILGDLGKVSGVGIFENNFENSDEAARTYNYNNSGYNKELAGQKFPNLKEGLKLVPDASLNLALGLASTKSIAGGIAEAYNPIPLPWQDGMKVTGYEQAKKINAAQDFLDLNADEKFKTLAQKLTFNNNNNNINAEQFNQDILDFNDMYDLMEAYRDDAYKKFGRELNDKELGLYAKLQEINPSRLKSLYPDEDVFLNTASNKLIVNDKRTEAKEILDPFIRTHEISKEYTPKEILLADAYQWGYDSYLNKRPDVTVDENLFNPIIDEFEELVKKNKTKRPEKFFRNQDDFYVERAWNKDGEPLVNKRYRELVPGDEYEPGSFVSTTLSPTNYSSGEFLTEIIVPENQSFLNMASTGNRKFYSEAENILPRNLRFRIENVEDYKSDDPFLLSNTNRKIRESIVNPYKYGGTIKDDRGYWNPDNWGKDVEIGSGDITMEGVYEPLIGVSKQTGEKKLMLPGKNYKFANTQSVIEKPLKGGWLDKYN